MCYTLERHYKCGHITRKRVYCDNSVRDNHTGRMRSCQRPIPTTAIYQDSYCSRECYDQAMQEEINWNCCQCGGYWTGSYNCSSCGHTKCQNCRERSQ
jgi:hypothetical protein